ncbi:MAG: ABC transporter permease [Planctomycetota bacterium]|jgi:ribose transport system permease protein|nr:ABC transporter permease [Planctomycetota bacterium]
MVARFLSDYGMLVVLLILCAYCSYATWDEQHPTGESGAKILADQIVRDFESSSTILVVARSNQEDILFAQTVAQDLESNGFTVLDPVNGQPVDARKAIRKQVEDGGTIDVIACNQVTGVWGVFDNLSSKFPTLTRTKLVIPSSYWWPDFLKGDNILNVANQIVVIAIIAIGMTMVIITGGIDLSVGSLIALSAVFAALLIRDFGGALEASPPAMVLSCIGAIIMCSVMGAFSGTMVTLFRIPPFIVTLAMMLVASGLAFILAEGQSIYHVPDTFIWLGRGTSLWKIPNAVVLMLFLYGIAHIVMTRMTLGRYIYAVGGNVEAARLSGVPVRRVLLFVYTVCGALAGLGGVVMASQLKSGTPTYGLMYELYVIAAVVVGGTSLAGGEGKVLGTLIGAFIIAVIQNGMNLTGVESYTQKVVLGLVILGAVLLDMLKKSAWFTKKLTEASV